MEVKFGHKVTRYRGFFYWDVVREGSLWSFSLGCVSRVTHWPGMVQKSHSGSLEQAKTFANWTDLP